MLDILHRPFDLLSTIRISDSSCVRNRESPRIFQNLTTMQRIFRSVIALTILLMITAFILSPQSSQGVNRLATSNQDEGLTGYTGFTGYTGNTRGYTGYTRGYTRGYTGNTGYTGYTRGYTRGYTGYTASTDLTPNSLIIYRAYFDLRMSWPAIRILAFAQCGDINATFRIQDSSGPVKIEPVEGSCPWKWAPSCDWSAFILTAHLRQRRPAFKSVSLSLGNRNAVVQVRHMPSVRSGLHVCVPPLYWFSDFAAVIQFIEIWKSQGASHFFIYYQSVSRTVLDVIKSYEKQGIVTVIEWRLVPSSTIDPNTSIYRIGHSLAHNDCLMRSNGRFVALVDIDEFILPNGTELLTFLGESLQRNPSAGSFVFEHSRLRFRQSNTPTAVLTNWRDVNFDKLLKSEFEPGNGPSKTVFLPDRTEIMLTHSAFRHLGDFKEVMVPSSKARLYHARNTWASPSVPGNFTSVQLLTADQVDSIREKYLHIMQTVTESRHIEPSLSSNVPKLVTRCLSRWKEQGCKTPYHSCRDSLLNQEDWAFSNDVPSSSPYVIL